MKKTLSALAAVAALSLAPLTPASASEPVGDVYAFASVPVDCKAPGAVQINYVEGVRWLVDGEPVEVNPPSLRIEHPNGWQGAVWAEPLPGYTLDDVLGTEERPFWLSVAPAGGTCEPASFPECDRAVESAMALREANAILLDRVVRRDAVILKKDAALDRKNAKIRALRAKIRALRAAR